MLIKEVSNIDEIPSNTTVLVVPGRKSPLKTILIGLLALGCIAAAAAFFMAKPSKKESKVKEAAPVTTAVVKLADVPLQLRSIGSVIPANSVSVKSRVGGRIVSIHFKEGDFVKRRDLLFTIDPRPLRNELLKAEADVAKQEAVISQAKAAIEKDKASILEVKANLQKELALAKLAEKDANRFVALAKAGAVSDAEAERRLATQESTTAIVSAGEAAIKNAEAQLKADQANLSNTYAQLSSAKATLLNANVQLNWTTVNSPLTGRTGRILTLRGNLIRPDEDILVTINQIAPIYVEFSIPQDQFQQVQDYRANHTLMVRAALPQGKVLAHNGKVTFVDNTVDSTTGTVKMRAVFDNTDSALWPGQYVDILLTLTTIKDAIIVPTQAIQTGQNGIFVWVLKDGVAHMQPVKIGPVLGGDTAISEGLKAGDVAITDGQLQLSEGAKVKVSEPGK